MKTIYLSVFLALAVSLSLQAQYSIESYESATPGFDYYYKPFAEQQDLFNLYAPSEITLKGNILALIDLNGDGQDDYNGTMHGSAEQALKIPINNGLWVLIMCLLGYAIVRRVKSYKF
jgi:hypothetical protein